MIRTGQRWQGRWRWGLAGLVLLAVAGAVYFWYVNGLREVRSVARAARAALAGRRFDEARRWIDRWIELRPHEGEPYFGRARVEAAADRPSEALAAIQQAHALGYPTEPLLVLGAVLQARAGQFEAAEPVLRRAFAAPGSLEAEVAEALTRIDLASFRLGEAAQAIERWMKAAPEDGRPYLWRTEIDVRIGADPRVLIRNYRAALQRDPTLDRARLGLAEELRKAYRVDEAEAEYATLLRRQPRSVAGHVGAGQIALLKGDLPAASRHFEAALTLDPRQPAALRELALIDLREGRLDAALRRLEEVIALEPFEPESRYHYARALRLAGDDARAAEQTAITERLRKEHWRIDELSQLLVLRPNDLDLRSEAAQWLIEHGHEPEGLKWAELILSQQPDHPRTCQVLADYHARKGDHGRANYYRSLAAQRPAKATP